MSDRFEDAEPAVQAPKNLEGRTELIGQKVAERKKGAIQDGVVTNNPGGTVLPLGEAKSCPPAKKRIILKEDSPVASRTRGSRKT